MFDKLGLLLEALKQPSTVKGILGLIAVFGYIVPEESYNAVVVGAATIYFLISIFWQKS